MVDIDYSPEFHHDVWVDNVDRVQADGPNGFNVRFKAIERDLNQVSTVVRKIDAVLDGLVNGPPPQPQRLTLNPVVTPIDRTLGLPSWFQNGFGASEAAHTAGLDSHGVMNLVLPDKVRLLSFRVRGRKAGDAGGSVASSLLRFPIFDGIPAFAILASVVGDTDPYDALQKVDGSNGQDRVDTSKYRYIVSVEARAITDNKVMTINSVEIVYIAD